MKQVGLSLIELLTTLVLIGLMLSLAVPSYQQFLAKGQQMTAVARLKAALFYARETAVARHQPISLCPTRTGTTCGGTWREGQLVFIDSTGNHQVSSTNQLLWVLPSVKGQLVWRGTYANFLQFRTDGKSRHQMGRFIFTRPGQDLPVQELIIARTGRVRQQIGAV